MDRAERGCLRLLPYTARMTDDIAVLRSVYQEAINHEPAITYMQTGFMVGGKPCLGSWLSYGLGTMNHDLPVFRRYQFDP
jgi:hypothetical protein